MRKGVANSTLGKAAACSLEVAKQDYRVKHSLSHKMVLPWEDGMFAESFEDMRNSNMEDRKRKCRLPLVCHQLDGRTVTPEMQAEAMFHCGIILSDVTSKTIPGPGAKVTWQHKGLLQCFEKVKDVLFHYNMHGVLLTGGGDDYLEIVKRDDSTYDEKKHEKRLFRYKRAQATRIGTIQEISKDGKCIGEPMSEKNKKPLNAGGKCRTLGELPFFCANCLKKKTPELQQIGLCRVDRCIEKGSGVEKIGLRVLEYYLHDQHLEEQSFADSIESVGHKVVSFSPEIIWAGLFTELKAACDEYDVETDVEPMGVRINYVPDYPDYRMMLDCMASERNPMFDLDGILWAMGMVRLYVWSVQTKQAVDEFTRQQAQHSCRPRDKLPDPHLTMSEFTYLFFGFASPVGSKNALSVWKNRHKVENSEKHHQLEHCDFGLNKFGKSVQDLFPGVAKTGPDSNIIAIQDYRTIGFQCPSKANVIESGGSDFVDVRTNNQQALIIGPTSKHRGCAESLDSKPQLHLGLFFKFHSRYFVPLSGLLYDTDLGVNAVARSPTVFDEQQQLHYIGQVYDIMDELLKKYEADPDSAKLNVLKELGNVGGLIKERAELVSSRRNDGGGKESSKKRKRGGVGS